MSICKRAKEVEYTQELLWRSNQHFPLKVFLSIIFLTIQSEDIARYGSSQNYKQWSSLENKRIKYLLFIKSNHHLLQRLVQIVASWVSTVNNNCIFIYPSLVTLVYYHTFYQFENLFYISFNKFNVDQYVNISLRESVRINS